VLPTPAGTGKKRPLVVADTKPPRLRRHRYDLIVIARLLGLVLLASVALRAAARACVLATALTAGPDPATGRLWLLRLGLHRLGRPVEPADDWCWLIDHTALLGRQRLFVVLGVRLRAWAARAARSEGALSFDDVRVLHLAAVEDPNGEQVEKHLLELKKRAGVPRAIVSDRGADVLAGIGRFRAEHADVAEVCDMKHFAANRLKELLLAQPRWTEFQTALGKTRASLQQTEWAFVVPPALRTKSRYLNLDVLLNWADKARALLALPVEQRAVHGDVERLDKALSWLRGMDGDLAVWREWLAVSEEAVRSVRERGLHAQAAASLAKRLASISSTESGRSLAERLVDFVREQQSQSKRGERLVGSTEVLESLFGRLKSVQKEHSRGGVTALALALPALLGNPNEQELAEALAGTATADVRRWVADNLKPNLQKKRCWLRSLLPPRQRKKKPTNKDRAAA
jgi:hypothetical protein